MKRTFQFSIRHLLVATAVVAIGLILGLYTHWRYFTPRGQYETAKSAPAFLKLVAENIHHGDSREHVMEHLGPGVIIDHDDPVRRAYFADPPSNLPDGLQQSDTWVMYSALDGIAAIFQFRNGKLINFVLPEDERQQLRQHWDGPSAKEAGPKTMT